MNPLRGRSVLAALAFGVSAAAPAQTVDLVTHNGFEDCWSQAIPKSNAGAPLGFLELLQASIDGQVGCIAPTSGTFNPGFGGDINYTACDSLGCSNNTVYGCQVIVHSGTFSGDFGTGAFSAAGWADDVTGPLTFSGGLSGNCTFTVSNITLTYAPYFYITPDGNNGDYMAYLTLASAVTITSDNVSVSGADLSCAIAASYSSFVTPQINAQAESAATSEMVTALSATAAGQSVCPLTP